jgi:hypothetical protein
MTRRFLFAAVTAGACAACGGAQNKTTGPGSAPASSASASMAVAPASSAASSTPAPPPPPPKPLRACFDSGDNLELTNTKTDDMGAALCAHDQKTQERSCWRVDFAGGWAPAPVVPDAPPPPSPDKHAIAADPGGVKACDKVLAEKDAGTPPEGDVSDDCKLAAVISKDGKRIDLFDVATAKVVTQIPLWKKPGGKSDDEFPRIHHLEFVDKKAILVLEDVSPASMAARLFDLKGKKIVDVGALGAEVGGDHLNVGTDLEAFPSMFEKKLFVINVTSGKQDTVDLSKTPQVIGANGGPAISLGWDASGRAALVGGEDKLALVLLGGDAHKIVDVEAAPICGAPADTTPPVLPSAVPAKGTPTDQLVAVLNQAGQLVKQAYAKGGCKAVPDAITSVFDKNQGVFKAFAAKHTDADRQRLEESTFNSVDWVQKCDQENGDSGVEGAMQPLVNSL